MTWPLSRSIADITAPNWDLVTDDQAEAEITRRMIEEPLLLFQPGIGPRFNVFRTTMRGVVGNFGGTQSAKSIGGGFSWVAALATGLLPRLTCPETCRQYAKGTCGRHCCPIPERGSALIEGCAGGVSEAHEVACAKHPPLWWPPGDRLILVGVQKYAKWNDVAVPALERFLSRYPDGSPQWRIDKQYHTITHDRGDYKIQCVSYEQPDDNESTSPIGIYDDEIPPLQTFSYQFYRFRTKVGQLRIGGTAYDLRDRPDVAGWIFPEIINKAPSPLGRCQVFNLDTRDNVFLPPEARAMYRELWEQLRAEGKDQECRIRIEGVPEVRQDACFFSKTTIGKQAAYIQEPQRRYVVLGSIEDSGREVPYFRGEHVFPRGCELSSGQREAIVSKREGTLRGGYACYDCLTPCREYVAPPRLARVVSEIESQIVERKPSRGQCHEISVWIPPQAGHRYALGADNAKGLVGGDYDSADVGDVLTGIQVAQFHDQVPPHIYAAVLYAIWRAYRPFMVVEENGYGTEILTRLMFEYEVPATDIFHRLDKKRRLPNGEPVAQPGYWTSRGTKSDPGGELLSVYGSTISPLGQYEQRLRLGLMSLRSMRSWLQLASFVQINGRLAGLPGTKDDTVISGALLSLGLALEEKRLRPGAFSVSPDEPIGAEHAAEALILPPGVSLGAPIPAVTPAKFMSESQFSAMFAASSRGRR